MSEGLKFDFANHHLSYTVVDEQPTIAIHAHPDNLEMATTDTDRLVALQRHLALQPFSHDIDEFGYGRMTTVKDSDRFAGWVALDMSMPKAPGDSKPYERSPQQLHVVSTAAALLHYLNHSADSVAVERLDPDHAQYIRVSMSNSNDSWQHQAARISAEFTPSLVRTLKNHADASTTEETIKAMQDTYAWLEGRRYDERFRVDLTPDNVSFDYPSDGGGFFSTERQKAFTEGYRLIAANNDHPYQQLTILAGLAVLNQFATTAE